MSEKLHFKVSAGLKNIIGKELINDKFIAIFELVKNSYDAGAKRVTIKFENIYDDEDGNLNDDNIEDLLKYMMTILKFLLLMMERECQNKK